jgi:hypothetical protein
LPDLSESKSEVTSVNKPAVELSDEQLAMRIAELEFTSTARAMPEVVTPDVTPPAGGGATLARSIA